MTTTNNAQNNASNSNSNSEYIDLHTNAFGYVNRFRQIGTGSKAFCAVTIAAFRGHKDEIEYTYFDTIIRNKDVCAELLKHEAVINDPDSKVLASVTISDIYAETFGSGDKVKATIKGRLIGMKSLTINGETVFKKTSFNDVPEDETPVDQSAEEQAPVNQSENGEAA